MARTHASRRRLAPTDCDSGSEDGYDTTAQTQDATITDTQREANARATMMNDLGTSTRDYITSVDKGGRKQVHVQTILDARNCNQEGTEEAKRAAKNKIALSSWNNYGNTTEAKADVIEDMRDISGGHSHRPRNAELRAAEEERLGRKSRLEDTYDDRFRRTGIPPPKISRGGSHAAANDRGHFSAARGGGFVGRGLGRAAAPPKPLDPAVDPDRVYRYKNGPGYQAESSKMAVGKAQVTMANNTVTVTASIPDASPNFKATKEKKTATKKQGRPWPPAALVGTPAFPGTQASSPSMSTTAVASKALEVAPSLTLSATQKSKSKSVPNKTTASSSNAGAVHTSRNLRPAGPTLAAPNDFMAAANSILMSSKPKAAVPAASTSTSAQPTTAQSGLLGSKYATSSTAAAPVETMGHVHRLAREEFRDPDLSPDKLTDGLLSTGKLSTISPSLHSEDSVVTTDVGVGLGIKGAGPGDSKSVKKNKDAIAVPLRKAPDLMDIDVPDVKEEVLIPSPPSKSPVDEMVSISKAEAQQWDRIKAILSAGDISGLEKFMKVDLAAPVASREGPKDSVSAGKGYFVNASKIGNILGDQNLPRAVSTQTTPSLAESKWAFAPKPAATFIMTDSTAKSISAIAADTETTRAPSPITISSSSSSASSSSLGLITARPVMQNVPHGEFPALITKDKFKQVSSIRTDFSFDGHRTVTITPTPTPDSSIHQTTTKTGINVAPSTVHVNLRKNPFSPGQPVAEAPLDYGEPVKLKPLPASSIVKPSTPIQVEIETQREKQRAEIKHRIEVARQRRAEEVGREQEYVAGRVELEQKFVGALRKDSDSKQTKSDSKPSTKVAKTSSTSSTRSLETRVGLAASKYAISQPVPVAKPTMKLQQRSTNISPQRSLQPATGPMRTCFPGKAETAIFGDARVVSRLPQDQAAAITTPKINRAPAHAYKRSTAIKHMAPEAGYELLMKDLQANAVVCVPESVELKTVDVDQAVAEAKGLAQQLGVACGDESDESEL